MSTGAHPLDVAETLPVPQLADVEVRVGAVNDSCDAHPAQEDVARGLHEPLALDDAPPLVVVPGAPRERREDRRSRLLELQDQRVVVVAAEEQRDQARVPTLPTPTTLRAMSTYR